MIVAKSYHKAKAIGFGIRERFGIASLFLFAFFWFLRYVANYER